MSEINMNDAPEGYYAVETESGVWYCNGCALHPGDEYCIAAQCVRSERADKKDVIFKPSE